MKHTLSKAASEGYSHIFTETTSYYTARLREKIGFECIYQQRYDEYLDENGQVIFNTKEPHEAAKILALPLQ